ncbi:MAG: GAF domain-containing protein [Candidatus Margulisbacteria bacterium]|jgi:signal transduction histidine kinase|nr:GAF domain-containing protein [Candidatus Margulisiibacteriota bacterium]
MRPLTSLQHKVQPNLRDFILLGLLALAYSGALFYSAALLRHRLEYFALAVGLTALIAALVLQIIRLLQTSQKRVGELTMLLEVSRLVNSTLDIQEIYSSVIQTVLRAVKVDRGILFLYDEQRKELRSAAGYAAGQQQAQDFSGMVLQVDNSVLGRIFKAGNPVLVPHPTYNTEYVKRLGADTYVAVPMQAKEKVIGLLTIDNVLSKRPLHNLNMALLMTLAGQLAVAIENAGLYADAREKIKELTRLNRVSSLGTMVAGIAHEIKNPLTALKMFTQLMEEHKGSRQFWDEFGPIIGAEIGRLETIIEEFLSFARTPEIKMQTVNFTDIAEKIFKLVKAQARRENVEIALNIEDGVRVRADTQKFMQVILNMLLNAIQAMPPGRPFKGYVELSARQTDRSVYIMVKDNGGGISREDQEKLFQPFFTTKQKGTGLGLSIARKIVEEHGGAIKVESEVNFGTTFTIKLPAVKQAQPAAPAAAVSPARQAV